MAMGHGTVHVVGIGGTLRSRSTSRWALERALMSAEQAGATTELLLLNDLRLPMYEPDTTLEDYDRSVVRLLEAVRRADALIWSTAGYHGTLAAPTKNMIDLLEFLSHDDRPYLTDRVVGLIATAGGEIAAVNSINAMTHAVHSLRGSVAPLLVPLARAHAVFDKQGHILDEKSAARLDQLGRLVAESVVPAQPIEIELGAS